MSIHSSDLQVYKPAASDHLCHCREFADWIARVHGSPCHVVYTDYRPTPLQHYVFPEGGSGLYMIVDEKSNFRDDNFQK